MAPGVKGTFADCSGDSTGRRWALVLQEGLVLGVPGTVAQATDDAEAGLPAAPTLEPPRGLLLC